MTPVPIVVRQRLIASMNRPAVQHQNPEVWEVVDDVVAMLKRSFPTKSVMAKELCQGDAQR